MPMQFGWFCKDDRVEHCQGKISENIFTATVPAHNFEVVHGSFVEDVQDELPDFIVEELHDFRHQLACCSQCVDVNIEFPNVQALKAGSDAERAVAVACMDMMVKRPDRVLIFRDAYTAWTKGR